MFHLNKFGLSNREIENRATNNKITKNLKNKYTVIETVESYLKRKDIKTESHLNAVFIYF
jgi:hypothetical protein